MATEAGGPPPVGSLHVPVILDTSGIERQAKSELARVAKKAGADLGGQWAREQALAMERQFKADIGRIKDGLVRGFLTREEAAQAGREAGEAYNRGIVQVIDQGRGRGSFRGIEGQELFGEIAGSIKDVDQASRAADIGMGRLNVTMASLFRQAVGAHPAVGQLLNVVSGFAIGSLATAGILAGLAAIAVGWRKITEGARDAKKDAEEAFEALREANRQSELGPAGNTPEQIEKNELRLSQLREDIAKAQAQLDAVGESPVSASGVDPSARRSQLQARIAALQADYDEIAVEVEKGRERVTKAEEGAEREGWRKVEELRERLRSEAQAKERERQQAAERLARAEDRLGKSLTGLTAQAADDLLLAIGQLEDEAEEAAAAAGTTVSESFIAGIARLREDARFQDVIRGFQEDLRSISSVDAGPNVEADLDLFISRLEEQSAALDDGSTAQAALNELLRRAIELRAKNSDAIAKNTERQQKETAATEKQAAAEAERQRAQELRDLRDRARLIEESARGGLQLAEAFGLVSDRAADALEAVAQLGSAVVRISGGDLTAIPSAIGGFAQLAGSLAGESNRHIQELRAAMEELSVALHELRREVAGDATSEERSGLVGLVEAIIDTGAGAVNETQRRFLERAAEIVGIDSSLLFDDQGRTNIETLQMLLERLRDIDLGVFSNTLEGQLEGLRFVWSQLGDAAGSAEERFRQFLEVVDDFGGSAFADEFRRVLEEEGPAAANAFIDGLAKRFAAGDQTLLEKGGIFAGLSAEDVRTLLEEGNGLIEALLDQTAGPASQDFVQARSITEVTAGRMTGALFTMIELDRIRNELLRAALGGAGGVSAGQVTSSAQIASLSSLPGAGSRTQVAVHIGQLMGDVTLDAPGGIVDRAQVHDVMREGAKMFADLVDRELGQKARAKGRALGIGG